MTVRRATHADTDALLALWAVARTSHAVTEDSAAAVRAVLDRSAVFVAAPGVRSPQSTTEPGLAGAIVAGWDGWRGNLYRLAVRPEHRREGLAGALVAAAEAWLIEQGAARLSILVGFDDADARGFWASVGYGADAVIGRMVRDLDSPS